MKKNRNRNGMGRLAVLAGGLLAACAAGAAEPPECIEGAEPLLSVADFDGNGRVGPHDLALLGRAIARGRYVAFYDRNADGRLDRRDLARAHAEAGRESTALDRDIATVFWATETYRALGRAALDGFEPVTRPAAGHGRHWMDMALFRASAPPGAPRLDAPAGLNYDEEGRLTAVFWGQPTAEPVGTLPPPRLFSEPQHWHAHAQACVWNYGLIRKVRYRDGVHPAVCAAEGGQPMGSFYMLHLWLYRLNPNGAFAMEHPCE